MTTFRHRLLEDGANSFDPKVFWPVNAFILVLLITACFFCWKFGRGNDDDDDDGTVTNLFRNHFLFAGDPESRLRSDRAYQRTVAARIRAREERRKDTPEKRKRRLLQSFQRCHVSMVVEPGDVVGATDVADCKSGSSIPPRATADDDDDNSNNEEMAVVVMGDVDSLVNITTENLGVSSSSHRRRSLGLLKTSSHHSRSGRSLGQKVAAAIRGSRTTTPQEDDSADFSRHSRRAATMENGDDGVAADEEIPVDVIESTDGLMLVDTSERSARSSTPPRPSILDISQDSRRSVVSDSTSTSPYGEHGADLEAGMGFLVLRHESMEAPRRVPNCCAICLCEYEVGEEVVWSSNQGCPHAFHSECIVDWLTKMQDGTPCPCCRQSFTDLEEFRKERKITWGAGAAFNPAAVSFR